MNAIHPSSALETPAPAPAQTSRSGKPRLWEDLIVTGFGLVTSTVVAWVSWWMAGHWDMAIYSFMINFIIPVGAIGCGIAAATGYWAGARLFNHRPTRILLFNIVLVSLTTFFMMHHFAWSNDTANGVPLSRLMSFSDYLVAVTENMTYSSSHGHGAGTELGKLGWGVAALQVLGFSFGGLLVYGWLKSVPYCDRCAKYLGEKKSVVARWESPEEMQAASQSVADLMQQGRLQEAVTAHAALAHGGVKKARAAITMELRKCPACDHRRLRMIASQFNGNQWAQVGEASVTTEDPIQM